jgi:hypothetical protein
MGHLKAAHLAGQDLHNRNIFSGKGCWEYNVLKDKYFKSMAAGLQRDSHQAEQRRLLITP